MHWIDLLVFLIYMIVILGVGLYFMRRNKGDEDYFLAGRSMSYPHIGLSVVATDVGGGFSIGLGGLGFLLGMSGSWMLFTGLLGAWLSAVFLIPKVKNLSTEQRFFTMPQLFGYFYSPAAALVAGVISAVGYIGFTSSQMLAGAKLASASFPELSLIHALYIMGFIIVVYTVMGGIKAVIYTDTFQWALLMFGLIFIGIPIAWHAVGGYEVIAATLPASFLRLDSISWYDFFNWCITIMPIWFVGMTLYQRIYASRSEKEAQKAWYLAGLFEWPIMAFMGVLLGLLARVAAEQGMFASLGFASAEGMDAEMGLPLLLSTVLPIGFMGLMMSAYFSAVMSTADSCLVAASGNVVTDILRKGLGFRNRAVADIRLSQLVTLALGALALGIAAMFENVLDIMLWSYAFMVSGLLVPVLGALYWGRGTPAGAVAAMIGGGLVTVWLSLSPPELLDTRLDPNLYGILTSALLFILISLTGGDRHSTASKPEKTLQKSSGQKI
ncbi:MAG: solute:Na+ symporter, SSS family [Bacteroidetes bacterium HLUCCA01]|nr:MAG: solute:Na+ symporter, SSS family [Bacteroidetes bacterium HLUCCA01]